MRILGIETSCDDTGLAIYDGEKGLIANVLHSQIEIHNLYGGVVPELASRDHIRKITPLLRRVLSEAQCSLQDIDAIAYTEGPGLMGALLVGAAFGQSLGFALGIPTIGIHHIEAHLLAVLLETPAPQFPFLALLVSGGHTMLIAVNGLGEYHRLGESVDDAAGEAFDKTAKILGLPYPGGPALAKFALTGDPNRFHFPRPMTDRPGLDFSFSGLKTAALNTFKNNPQDEQTKADIARAFEDAVADTLQIKCKRAIKETQLPRLIIAGGVAANLRLRQTLKDMAESQHVELFYPRTEFCTDNGAMTALTGYYHLKTGLQKKNLTIDTRARWPLGDKIGISK